MSMKTNNNTLGIIAIIMSILALVSCFIIALCSRQNLQLDETMLLLSVLSLIVTILIGMQIWNIFQFERKFEKVEQKSREEIERARQGILEANKVALEKNRYEAIGTVLMQLGWSFEDKKEYDDAMRTYINSLRSFQRSDLNDPEVIINYKEVVERLVIISNEIPPEEWNFVNMDEKNVYVDAVMKIPEKEIVNQLLNFFYKFTVHDGPFPVHMRTPSPSDL